MINRLKKGTAAISSDPKYVLLDEPFAGVDPIAVNDIDYIEVTRSPGTATYGISALMAVINIVTKDPLNSSSFAANITADNDDNYQRLHLSFAGKSSEKAAYRISASAIKDNGSESEHEEHEEFYDDTRIDLFNSTVNFKISPSTQAFLSFYHSDNTSEDPTTDAAANSQLNIDEDEIKTRSSYFLGKVNHAISTHHDMSVKAYYTRVKQTDKIGICSPTVLLSQPLSQLSFLNPDYANALLGAADPNSVPLSGSAEQAQLRQEFITESNQYGAILYGTETCGIGNGDSLAKNTAVEIEDTYIFNENLRLVSGFGVTQQNIDSMAYFQGEVSSTTYRVFANTETRWNSWVFNSGVMLEYNDDAYEKTAVSPRLGANYRLNDDNTLRFVLSKAVQIPDVSDRELNAALYLENFTMPYPADGRTEGYRAFANGSAENMESQEILAREISLYTQKRHPFNNQIINIHSDIKLFYNSLYYRPYYNYDTVGATSSSTLKGFETDINIVFRDLLSDSLDNIDFQINYTYLDSDRGEILEDSAITVGNQEFLNNERFIKHSGSTYSIFNFKNSWFTALAYTGNTTKTSSFETYEFGFGKNIALSTGALTLGGKLSHQNTPDNYPIEESPTAFFFNISFSR